MNRYQPSTPRFALGAAALAMMLSTLGVLVVVPSKLEIAAGAFLPASQNGATAAAPRRATMECANVSAAQAVLARRSKT